MLFPGFTRSRPPHISRPVQPPGAGEVVPSRATEGPLSAFECIFTSRRAQTKLSLTSVSSVHGIALCRFLRSSCLRSLFPPSTWPSLPSKCRRGLQLKNRASFTSSCATCCIWHHALLSGVEDCGPTCPLATGGRTGDCCLNALSRCQEQDNSSFNFRSRACIGLLTLFRYRLCLSLWSWDVALTSSRSLISDASCAARTLQWRSFCQTSRSCASWVMCALGFGSCWAQRSKVLWCFQCT